MNFDTDVLFNRFLRMRFDRISSPDECAARRTVSTSPDRCRGPELARLVRRLPRARTSRYPTAIMTAASTYRVVVVSGRRHFELVDRERREPPPGQARIRVEARSICHTDALAVDGMRAEPIVPAHEIIGSIEALGEGAGAAWKVGDRVGVGFLGGQDNICDPCRRGDFVNCTDQPRWIGSLFDPVHREATITALLAADDSADRVLEHVHTLRSRVAAAEVVMEKLQRALNAGWDPTELREQYNAAVAEKRAAEAGLAEVPQERGLSREDLESYIDQLGDVGRALNTAEPEELSELYSSLRLALTYDHVEQKLDVEVDPLADRVVKSRVRGGT